MRRGLEKSFRTNSAQSSFLETWIEQVESRFRDRIIPIDTEVANRWGQITADRSRPVVDTLIAATALVHGMTLVTRNVSDVAGTGVTVLNPWN